MLEVQELTVLGLLLLVAEAGGILLAIHAVREIARRLSGVPFTGGNRVTLLVVDGRTGFIGGLNLGDEYLGYRDTHVRIDGPAAQHIQFSFAMDWYWAVRRLPGVAADLATVGTVNLDNRSLYLNFEATAVVADAAFAAEVGAMLERDLEHSALVGREQYCDRPLWFRLAARVSRLFSPLL